MLLLLLITVFGVAPVVAADPKAKPVPDPNKTVRPAGPAECERPYPDKTLCPPKTMPESRRCEVLAADISGLSGLTGYVNEQKKMDMRKQYKLMCATSRGSEFECEHLTRDLAGSTGTKGFVAETRKGDLRWIYERRCATVVEKQDVVPAIIVR